jgi:hypothetical protein
MATLTLRDRITELVEKHGSFRNVGAVIDVDHVYLYRLHKGERADPSDDVLKKLKLKRVVVYEDATRRRTAK